MQIGVPSRSAIASYSAIEAEIGRRVAALNARHAVPDGPPVVHYHTTALESRSLVALYRLAHICVVSSLHDGMNLVAKEFVAARDDEDGVLVLSELAGAAHELRDALIINPYDVDGFADALAAAVDMPRDERRSACARCGASSPAGTSSAGPRTSSKASRASGPHRCSIRFVDRRTPPSDAR